MGLELEVELPFGRYCATPWGRHVNEGAVEWPPSPWRVVRALVSSWLVHHPALGEAEVTEALDCLCGEPTYRLPAHTEATTRHYMPTGTAKSMLGLNAFVATVPGARVQMMWDVEVNDAQAQTLQQLASTVTYLGRAESRARLSFTRASMPTDGLAPVRQLGRTSSGVLDLLVPSRPLDLDAVRTTTGQLHKQRRMAPPGARWVTYPLPAPMPVVATSLRRPERATTVLEFTVSGRGRPTIDNAALVASRFRAAVTSRASDRPELHGHVGNGGSRTTGRADDHQHAHFLALNDLERPTSRRIDSLVLWVPEGVPEDALRDIARLRRLGIPEHLSKRLGSAINLTLVQAGDVSVLSPRLVSPSRRWLSLTPVTTVRHRKKHQSPQEFVDDVVRRELAHHHLPSAPDQVLVSLVPDEDVASPVRRARRTYRARSLGRERQHQGFHVALEFADEVEGPLVLGSLSHFGLGTFVSDDRV